MKHFFTSDLHFGHNNIMKYSHRTTIGLSDWEIEQLKNGENFRVSDESVNKMNDILVEKINQYVKKDDILWFLGDFLFAPRHIYYQKAKEYRDRINCKTIYMFWGNHDEQSIHPLFNGCFQYEIIAINKRTGEFVIGYNRVRKLARHEFQLVSLKHSAEAIWFDMHKGAIHFYGHSHANAEENLDKIMPGRRSIDVGVDNAYRLFGEYRPFEFSPTLDLLNSRKGCLIDHHDSKE